MSSPVDEAPLDVERYVQDLTEGRIGVEVFCAAMEKTRQELAAERILRKRSAANAQVLHALRRLAPDRSQ